MTMLDRMRRHKGWLKWSLALVVLAFIVFYIPSFLDDPTAVGVGIAPGEVVAEVEGRDLTVREYRNRYNTQIQAYRGAFGGNVSDELLRQLGIEQQILQEMIDEQATIEEAERQGIRVSDEELARQIFSIPALQENGQFVGEARYEQLLRNQIPPLTKPEFEAGLRRSMMIEKLRAALTDWIAVSETELEREFTLRNEKIKLQVVALTADAFLDNVTVTDADVAVYYDSHSAEYRIGEQRKVRMMLIDRAQALAGITIPATDVERYYNDNFSLYRTPEQIRASHILFDTAGEDEGAVRAQAEDVLAQVRAGGDFAELARTFSEDEGTKELGGDLDYFSRGRMVPEFEAAAFALGPGEVSDLVTTQFGFHIIKVVEKTPEVTRPLDEVRSQIEEQLRSERADQQVAARAAELAGRIARAADLDLVAGNAGLTVTESDFFENGDPIPGLGIAPQVSVAAFQLTGDAVSGPITSLRGPVFITLSETRDPYVPPLAEVQERVRDDAIRARATELSRQRADQMADALRTARDFAAVAKAQGFEATETDLITRESPLPDVGISAEIDQIAFGLPIGGVSDPITTPDGTAIVKVVERDDVTPEEFKLEREAFRAQFLSERRDRFFTAYMSKAKARMRIEINDDVIRRLLTPTI